MRNYLTVGMVIGTLTVGAFSGCATPGQKTGIGAAGGAAGGAIIGGVAGGTKGALIGGAIGALAGGSVGNYLDKQAKELSAVADTERTTNGILVKLKNDLLFETNSAILKPDATAQLKDLSGVLVKFPEDRIRIEGFTDSEGSEAYNQSLSERRAKAVQNALVENSVQPVQMIVVGNGEARPIADNKTSRGRAQNRRVELHIDVPQKKKG